MNVGGSKQCSRHNKLSLSQPPIWRSIVKRRQKANSTAMAAQTFPLERLPVDILVHVASQLKFADLKNVGVVSKKLNKVERITHCRRKQLSMALLKKLFPENFPAITSKEDSNAGVLAILTPLRKHLRSTATKLSVLDLSEFCSFKESHFLEIARSVNNIADLFSNVCRLYIQNCVMELNDFEFLSKLMPNVWFIRLSSQHIVLPKSIDLVLDADQKRNLQLMIENFTYLSKRCEKHHLWIIKQLLGHFNSLELIQIDE